MTVREEVSATLDALCEGAGVSEDSDGDFAVALGEVPRWVRVYDEPAATAVAVFGTVAFDIEPSPALGEFLNEYNCARVFFRAFCVEEEIILRADLMATPFVPAQLQVALEDFDRMAGELAAGVREFSRQ